MSVLRDVVGDALHDQVQGHQVVAPLQHHDVGILPGGLHELLVHGLHRGQILGHHRLHGAPPLLHVPQGPAENAHIGVGLHEDLDIQQVPQLFILEDQDALHDDHLGGPDLHGLVGAVVQRVVIHGAVDGLARLQLFQVLDHQVRVEGVRVVVILLAALLEGAVLPLIVVVVVHHGDIVAEPGHQVLREGGFAAAVAPGDADEEGVHISASRISVYSAYIIKNFPAYCKGTCKKSMNFQGFQLTRPGKMSMIIGYNFRPLSVFSNGGYRS